MREFKLEKFASYLEKAETLKDFEKWDQVIDYGIRIPSGEIVIMGVTDYLPDATKIKMQPGRYHVRIFMAI